jgi:integrase/recombinase XerD
MDGQLITVTQLVSTALQHLQDQKYSKLTIIRHRGTWNKLLKHAETNEIQDYTLKYGMDFIKEYYGVDIDTKMSEFHVFLMTSMKILYEIQQYGTINTKRNVKPVKQPEIFFNTLDMYCRSLSEQNLCYKTIYRKVDMIRILLLFLENKRLMCLSELTAKNIYDFLETRKSLALTTRESELYIIRDFIRFLASHNICKQELGKLFPVISVHSKDSIPSFFTTDEIKRVLNCIDRNSRFGKRDYAILLLAVQLGMRAGDIRNLKMSNIKWSKKCVEFIQQKTKNFISIPLPNEAMLALLDYLKNSRPQSEKLLVFIKASAPYTDYADSNSFHNIVKKYLEAAKIEYKSSKHHGLHSMRHSLAGNMLLDGTPMPIISNILGHRYSDTTTKYLKIDIPQLRQVALEVPHGSNR